MENRLYWPNPKRKRNLLWIFFELFAFIVITVALVLVVTVRNKNYGGLTQNVSGVVKTIVVENGTSFVKIDTQDKRLSAAAVQKKTDLNRLVGRRVIFQVPMDQFGDGPQLILGIIVDTTVVVSAQETIKSEKAEMNGIIIFIAFLTLACAFMLAHEIIWRIKNGPYQLYPLAEKYAEYFSMGQPSGFNRTTKRSLAPLPIFLSAFMLLAIFFAITFEASSTTIIVMSVIAAVLLVLGIVLTILVRRKMKLDAAEFYEKYFPFDFSDEDGRIAIKSAFPSNKKENRHSYFDGGNFFEVQFVKDGVDLYLSDDPIADIDVPERKFVYHLSYDRLNFEAIPFVSIQNCPLFVVIKSRLPDASDYPEKLQSDLHLIFDLNLQETLKEFDVPVENLDEIMSNIKQLILHGNKKLPPL